MNSPIEERIKALQEQQANLFKPKSIEPNGKESEKSSQEKGSEEKDVLT